MIRKVLTLPNDDINLCETTALTLFHSFAQK